MSKRALIVVDLQNEYLATGNLPLDNIDAVVANAVRVIADARAKGDLVIHVRHEFATPGMPVFVPGSAGVEIIPAVAPADGEKVIVKNHVNSYRDTDLKQYLDAHDVKNVTVIGAMTHMCIDAAVRASADFGYTVTVLHDACATRDLEFGGATTPAAQVQTAMLAAFAFGYAAVKTVDEYTA
jgi:nicotinamidase-related amidase